MKTGRLVQTVNQALLKEPDAIRWPIPRREYRGGCKRRQKSAHRTKSQAGGSRPMDPRLSTCNLAQPITGPGLTYAQERPPITGQDATVDGRVKGHQEMMTGERAAAGHRGKKSIVEFSDISAETFSHLGCSAPSLTFLMAESLEENERRVKV